MSLLNINHDKNIHLIEFDTKIYSQFDVARIINDFKIKYIKFYLENDKYILLIKIPFSGYYHA
jgi:hypothetical protein